MELTSIFDLDLVAHFNSDDYREEPETLERRTIMFNTSIDAMRTMDDMTVLKVLYQTLKTEASY